MQVGSPDAARELVTRARNRMRVFALRASSIDQGLCNRKNCCVQHHRGNEAKVFRAKIRSLAATPLELTRLRGRATNNTCRYYWVAKAPVVLNTFGGWKNSECPAVVTAAGLFRNE